jgi:hypothetical protein
VVDLLLSGYVLRDEVMLCSGGLSVRTLGCCWAAGASTSGWYGAGQGYQGGGKRVVAAGRNCCVGGMRLQLGMEWPFAGWRREEEVSRGCVSSHNQLLLVK